jgi:hypothetical protein
VFILLALGLGLSLLVSLAYGALRASPWAPHDGGALAWARMHGFTTALIAAVALLFMIPGLDSLRHSLPPDTYGIFTKPGAEAMELPASPLNPGTALLAVLAPALWLFTVYAVAQRTWPRATGPVRRARLASRQATSLLPPLLTRVAAGIGVAALAAVVLAWTAPGAAPLHLRYSTGDSTIESSSGGVRPGTEVAPWLLLALAALVVAAIAVTVLVSRRPALSGLTADEDLAVRHLAAHRVLRTATAGALMVLAIAVISWADGTLQAATREAYGSLDAMAAAYADGITIDAEGAVHQDFTAHPPTDLLPGPYTLASVTPVAAVLGMLVLLMWPATGVRTPAVKEQVRA